MLTKTKKARNRRKAKSVRAIKAYWKARAWEVNRWLYEANEELDYVYHMDVTDGNYYGQECWVEDALQKVHLYEGMLRNAVSRYCMAIPKGGIGKY